MSSSGSTAAVWANTCGRDMWSAFLPQRLAGKSQERVGTRLRRGHLGGSRQEHGGIGQGLLGQQAGGVALGAPALAVLGVQATLFHRQQAAVQRRYRRAGAALLGEGTVIDA